MPTSTRLAGEGEYTSFIFSITSEFYYKDAFLLSWTFLWCCLGPPARGGFMSVTSPLNPKILEIFLDSSSSWGILLFWCSVFCDSFPRIILGFSIFISVRRLHTLLGSLTFCDLVLELYRFWYYLRASLSMPILLRSSTATSFFLKNFDSKSWNDSKPNILSWFS